MHRRGVANSWARNILGRQVDRAVGQSIDTPDVHTPSLQDVLLRLLLLLLLMPPLLANVRRLQEAFASHAVATAHGINGCVRGVHPFGRRAVGVPELAAIQLEGEL